MISTKYKILFIHVPKTGGNSIQNILKYYSDDIIVAPSEHQDGIERFEVRNNNYNITKHSNLSQYKSVMPDDIYNSLFKFATIRNPWDMMISYYFSSPDVTVWDRQIFLNLLRKIKTLRWYICENTFVDKLKMKTGFVKNSFKNKLDSNIDFLMRFERLEEDFQIVCDQLNIEASVLPKRNVSDHKHYSQYYDEELKKMVTARFAEEIEFGEYTFEIG